jgi:hypothetical protein
MVNQAYAHQFAFTNLGLCGFGAALQIDGINLFNRFPLLKYKNLAFVMVTALTHVFVFIFIH